MREMSTHWIIVDQGNGKQNDRGEYDDPTFPEAEDLPPRWHGRLQVLDPRMRIVSCF